MLKWLIPVITSSAGASLGWWLGSGVGFMTGYFLAVAGASAGWYFGRRQVRRLGGE